MCTDPEKGCGMQKVGVGSHESIGGGVRDGNTCRVNPKCVMGKGIQANRIWPVISWRLKYPGIGYRLKSPS